MRQFHQNLLILRFFHINIGIIRVVYLRLLRNPSVTLYIPKTFSKSLERELLKLTKNIIPVRNNLQIAPNFYLIVSENFWIRELAWVLKHHKVPLF